jgi:hypothetical protein
VRITATKHPNRKGLTAVVAAAAGLILSIGPAGAITFGQPDGNLHPNVGVLLADYDPDSPGPDILCSGTLIDEQVCFSPRPTARRSWRARGSARSG